MAGRRPAGDDIWNARAESAEWRRVPGLQGLARPELLIRAPRNHPRTKRQPHRRRHAAAGHWLVRECRHLDRKSTRLNSSHSQISYAVFCLKKKKKKTKKQNTKTTKQQNDKLIRT